MMGSLMIESAQHSLCGQLDFLVTKTYRSDRVWSSQANGGTEVTDFRYDVRHKKIDRFAVQYFTNTESEGIIPHS